MANHSIVWLFYGLVLAEYSNTGLKTCQYLCSRHYIYLILNFVDQENCELTAVGGVRKKIPTEIVYLANYSFKKKGEKDLDLPFPCAAGCFVSLYQSRVKGWKMKDPASSFPGHQRSFLSVFIKCENLKID